VIDFKHTHRQARACGIQRPRQSFASPAARPECEESTNLRHIYANKITSVNIIGFRLKEHEGNVTLRQARMRESIRRPPIEGATESGEGTETIEESRSLEYSNN
jgi:hypothetical protein